MTALSFDEVKPILAEFGRRHAAIQKLEVFGSVVSGRMSERSDLDVLVSFGADAPLDLRYFRFFTGLQEEMEQLTGRKVDLLDRGALSEDLFSRSVVRGAKMVYERR